MMNTTPKPTKPLLSTLLEQDWRAHGDELLSGKAAIAYIESFPEVRFPETKAHLLEVVKSYGFMGGTAKFWKGDLQMAASQEDSRRLKAPSA